MSRWIDADEIENAKFQEEDLRGMGEHIAYRVGWNEAIESILENAPTIEIIRCGECKYWKSTVQMPNGTEVKCLYGRKDDDFCSYGQKGDENVETD